MFVGILLILDPSSGWFPCLGVVLCYCEDGGWSSMERSERINYFLFDFKVWNTFAGVCEVLLSPAQKGTWEHFHEQSRGLETNPVNTS